MARAHFVKKARKDNKAAGIKRGDSYYWWAFMVGGRGGPKHYSKTPPKRSQLTQSDFYKSLYDIEDRISDLKAEEGLKEEVESIIEDIRALAEEQDEKKSNMPEGLQEGDTGQLLDERKDGLESWADELEGIDCEVDEDEIKGNVLSEMGYGEEEEVDEDYKKEIEEKTSEKIEEAYQEKLDEIQGCSHSL